MKRTTIKQVLSYVKKHAFFLVASLFFAAVSVVLTLYVPILTGDAIDLIIEPGKVDFAGIGAILVKIAACIGITAVAQWVMNVCNNRITYYVVRDIRKDAFKKIEILPLKYIDGHSHGEVVDRKSVV